MTATRTAPAAAAFPRPAALAAAILVVLAATAALRAVPALAAGEFLNAPPDPLAGYAARTAPPAPRQAGGLSLLFGFYQKYVGGYRGFRCPMEPSCSEYSRRAIARHGMFVGLAMTADRLLRCGSDLEYYPLVLSDRGLAHADPVP